MSTNVNTKPRAQRIDSQDEAVASSVEATERREAAAQDHAPAATGDSPAPKPRTTRNRLLTITQRFATFTRACRSGRCSSSHCCSQARSRLSSPSSVGEWARLRRARAWPAAC